MPSSCSRQWMFAERYAGLLAYLMCHQSRPDLSNLLCVAMQFPEAESTKTTRSICPKPITLPFVRRPRVLIIFLLGPSEICSRRFGQVHVSLFQDKGMVRAALRMAAAWPVIFCCVLAFRVLSKTLLKIPFQCRYISWRRAGCLRGN